MAIQVGVIQTLIGKVTATDAAGAQRILQVGDKVFSDEIISTGATGAVEIKFADGSVMDMGRNSQTVLDNEVVDPNATLAVADEVEAIQQALLAGDDPTQTAEATAAGAGVEGENEGHQPVQVIYEAPEVDVTSGFDTTGITVEFSNDEEEQGFDDVPTAGITTVLLDEDDLGDDFYRDLNDDFFLLQQAFTTDTGLFIYQPFVKGNDDEVDEFDSPISGDDLPREALTVIAGTLNADYGNDGEGDIVFNAENTQPQGLSSGGEAIQYWVSDDGHSLIAYISSEPDFTPQILDTGEDQAQEVQVIFTAEITDTTTGAFRVALYGPVDHDNQTTEDNLIVNLGFTITDSSGDPAQGILRLDIDDDSPIIENMRGEDFPEPQGEDFILSTDIAKGEDTNSNGLDIIHDESDGAQPSFSDFSESDDLFTSIFPDGGPFGADMIGMAIRPVESFSFSQETGPRFYDSGIRYNAGADGLKNLALTDADGELLNGQDSGLTTSDTGESIYLYTIPNDVLLQITGGNIPAELANYADNFVVGLTVPNLDLTDLDALMEQYDSPEAIVGDLALVIGLIEDVGQSNIFSSDSQDDAIALIQLRAINHPNADDSDDTVSIENLIHITITDNDGDSATSEAISISFDDDGPSIGKPETGYVDEEGLITGNEGDSYDDNGDIDGTNLTATGSLDINWGADNDNDASSGGDRTVVFDSQTAPEGLTSNGVAVAYSINDDNSVLTAKAGDITVFTVTLSDLENGSFNFEQFDNLDHSTESTEDDINLSFSFTAKDADGDTDFGSFNVSVNDDAPVIGAPSTGEEQQNSILLGARDGSADLSNWGVTSGLTGEVTINGIKANIEFIDNDSNPNSTLKIYNNNANHIGGGSLADDDGQGINAGETLSITFDQVMLQAEVGVDGLGNHFLPDAPQQAHATWIAYKDDDEVARGEIDNPEGQNEGLAGLLEVYTIAVPGGFDRIDFGNNSNNSGSNYEVRYIEAKVNSTIIDEEGLRQGNLGDSYSDGGDVAGANLVATADLNISWGADDNNSGNANRSISFDSEALPEGLSSNSTAIVYSINEEGTELTATAGQTTVFTVTLSDLDSGSFVFRLLANLDHDPEPEEGANTEDNLELAFGFIATDSDGDSVPGSFTVTVDDDGPTSGKNSTVRLDDDVLDGNPGGRGDNVDAKNITGTLNHSVGADNDGTVLLLDSSQKPGFVYQLNDTGTILTISQGDTAVLQVALNDTTSGDYTVTQLAAIDHQDQIANRENNIAFRVDYQVTDGDGDSVNGSININVDDDTPITEDDDIQAYEDTAITFDVLGNDSFGADGGEISGYTQPENGQVVLNDDNTFTFTPATNLHGQETFTYTLTDGDGDTSTATVTIDVEAVADAPNLVVSLSNGTPVESDINLIVNGSFEDVAGHDQNNNEVNDADIATGNLVKRLDITGWETTKGAPMEPHHKDHAGVGSTDGDNYMDLGASPGNTSISQEIDVIEGAEYKLSFDYRDKAAMQESGQAGEDSGVMQVVWNGNVVATVEGNNRDSWATLNNIVLIGAADTNTLTFSEVGVPDDNWGIAIDNVQMVHVPYQYNVNVVASLTDTDGSEVLGTVDISSLPAGTSLVDGVLISETPLTAEQINAMTASVTSTETSNNNEATTSTTARVDFDGLDATGETADLLIEGTSGDDSIIGGAGDDIIFGGIGNDSLTGGDGADEFIWNSADVGSVGTPAHDTVQDFDASEGDVLNLSDLLSDGSHSIEGIDNGSGDLQVNIKDTNGNVVQEIELSGVSIDVDASTTLQSLLDTGVINDGI